MISPEFERLLKVSLPKCLKLAMGERFPGVTIDVKETDATINDDMQEAIILTLSGHLFRMFIAIIFNKSAGIDQLIQSALAKKTNELDNAAFYDYLNEVGNVLCGSIKRDIQKAIPSLGMSTPNLLNIESFKYMKDLKIDQQGGYALSKDQSPLFYVNYYLGEYGKIEFCQNINIEEEEVDSGELEFF